MHLETHPGLNLCGTCPLLIPPFLSFLLSSLMAELILVIVFHFLSCEV
jgi:hypothetical protein